jgi:uncharacterized protein YjeT (DUF2065 family)
LGVLDSDTLWTALGLVLVFEGLMPFASPAGWRRLFLQVLQLEDGQIRFFGLCAILLGLGLLWLFN